MELTNPINNQVMVDGLNKVLHLTHKNKFLCELTLTKGCDDDTVQIINALMSAHDRHIDILKDSIRYLGGAPINDEPPSTLDKIGGAFLSVSNLRRQEMKLVNLCSDQIKCLTGSDESVEKLNIIKDDILSGIS